MKTQGEHDAVVKNITSQIKDYIHSHRHKKLRFYHGGTNSTREQSMSDKYYFIDISHLNDVIEVNTEEKYALVEPNVPMEKLVKTTLAYNLLPPVVMEFPGITVGGAVNGATLEASSYKYGQLNDNCQEYEIILGDGEIIHASQKEHNDLFYGISGSYGSLGLLTLIKVKLIPAKPYVRTVFSSCADYTQTIDQLENEVKKGNADFVDAVVFDKDHGVVITGYFHTAKDEGVETFTKASDKWFYERAEKLAKSGSTYEELIPIFDFLFRYNRGAFWMGEYAFPLLHLPDTSLVKRLLNPFMNAKKLYDGLHALNISQNYFIQDFYCPVDRVIDFLKESEKKLSIFPVWLCPIKPAKTAQKLSPNFVDTDMLVDIGIWGQSKKYLADPIGINKEFEDYARGIGARKMLYAHAYYSEDEFWSIYDKAWYQKLRTTYHAEKIFPDVWEKTHVGNRRYEVHFWKGIFQILIENIRGKH